MSRRHQLGEIVGAGDVAGGEAGTVGELGAPHAEHAGLGVHRLDEGALATRVVSGQRRGGAVFRRHQGDVQHVGPAQARAHRQPRPGALESVHVGHGDGQHLGETLIGIEHHQCRHQLGDGGYRHHPIGVALRQHFTGARVGHHEGGGAQRQIVALLQKAVGGVRLG